MVTVDLTTYGFVLVALAHTALAVQLIRAGYFRASSGTTQLAFAGAVVTTAAWGWAGYAAQYFQDAVSQLAGSFFDLLRYSLWFVFLLSLIWPHIHEARRSKLFMLVPVAGVLVLAGIFSVIAGASSLFGNSGFARLLLLSFMALPVFGMVLVEQIFRNVSDDLRWSTKPLCLGLGCVFIYDLFIYSNAVLFGHFDSDSLSVRGGVHAVSAPLLLVASRRHADDWVGKVQLSRSAAFHSTTLLLAGGYLLFISGIGYYVRYFGGEWGRALQFGLLAVGLLCLGIFVLSGTVRSKVRVLVHKNFFRYRYDYREEWLRFTAMLSARSAPHEVGGLVIKGLADMIESPAGALWAKGQDDEGFVQIANWNTPRSAERLAVDSGFAKFLLEKSWVVDIGEYKAHPQRYGQLEVPTWILSGPAYWLVVPLIVGDELIGFVVLAQSRAAVDVNWEVTDLLKTASRQAASFLSQMQTTEALLEVRKFEAFNRMSAFVVHDLKNIITQLSLMLKNAKRLHNNPEFQHDMLVTVESSLEKMRQLMLQLREGHKPPGGSSGVDLVPIVRRIEAVAAGRGRTLELQVLDRLVTRGHEERIERVLGHIVQNAFDATTPSDRVWLKLQRASGQAKLEVGDTGHGMSPDFVRTRLFKPFQTTKTNGMGIGAYESAQYLQELGGNISVVSEVDRGTVVTIGMPLFESHRESDLSALGAR